MDFSIEWSPEAVEDIEAIATYIAKDSEFYARSVVREILRKSREIAQFPSAGRMVPEVGNAAIRERFVYSYRLVYRIEKEKILIVAVIHGKRLLENMEERFNYSISNEK